MSSQTDLTAEDVARHIVGKLPSRLPSPPRKPPEVRESDDRRRAIIAARAVGGCEIDPADCDPTAEAVTLTIKHHSGNQRERDAAIQLLRTQATRLGFAILSIEKESQQCTE